MTIQRDTMSPGVSKRHLTLQKLLRGLGVLASMRYVVVNDVISASLYPGYDRVSRSVSELSVTYAPARPNLVALPFIRFAGHHVLDRGLAS